MSRMRSATAVTCFRAGSALLEGEGGLGPGRLTPADRHERRGMRVGQPSAPIHDDEAAATAPFLPDDVEGDVRGELRVVHLLQDVERGLGEHRADERLTVPGGRYATEPAVGIRAGADQ